jgi:hypothetical protein
MFLIHLQKTDWEETLSGVPKVISVNIIQGSIKTFLFILTIGILFYLI